MIDRFDALLARPVNLRSLGLVRILVGAVTLMHLWPFLHAGLEGDTYLDHFHQPYVSWYPELPAHAYTAVVLLGCFAAITMSLGLWSQVATRLTFAVVAYNLFLSETHMHNNAAYLFAVLGLLALAPCGRALSLDAWLRVRRGKPPFDATAPGWPLWLLRFECATVYAASGASKLLNPDWLSGTVPWGRMVEVEAQVRASILPSVLDDLLLNRSFYTVAAKFIIATELFIASGLWSRRTRPFALIAAVIFHIAIQFTANVQIFSYLGVSVLFIWADPALPWLRLPHVRRNGTREEVPKREFRPAE